MSKYIGSFEELVLIAISRCGQTTVKDIITLIEKHIGKKVSTGSIYTTLERLTDKEFISCSLLPKESVRGGRSKKVYMLTDKGDEIITIAEIIRYQVRND